ncbi:MULTISPECIES: MBOAT family protein [Bacteroides]|jgi:alginate O-acetyltransferase complex protein AlgI|uniref:MBOAT family O-acyltransferase n=1 Tax=Bacteroides TaxID=816 RepID=UPI000E4A7A5B|nr:MULTISPECIES: MBOAT family O-acyltransferase [Bacteroides]RHL10321.1 MBOAT family protein [Bacteroides sp. AF39-11AC]
MLFNSFEFLFFLPIVFLFYWFVFKRLKWQNLFLVIASYVFYGWWDWRFLILIALTTFFSYISGRLIVQYEGRRKIQKAVSGTNIILNLSILGVFKYYNFFAENFAVLFRNIGWQVDWVTLDILLPVGISFYTFQALSYSIDVYQKKLPVCKDIIAFFAYISFFPQLVAGPIERATNLLPQFYKSRTFDYAQAVDGCRQMLWGFFKKIVVADNCAEAANVIWGDYSNQSGFTLLLGGFFFTFQIYGDFSGYSDIAIGTARLFGINLMRNFNFPYFSRDIAEFWRRWHISLTTWFRDYIYIPLGGSRCVRWKVMRNTLIIFLVSGFWHGANWTFITWGAYHALLFFPLMLWGKNRKYTNSVAAGRFLPSVKEFGQMLFTFLLALIGWIIFRAENIGQAWDYLGRMCSSSLLDISIRWGKSALLYIVLLVIVEWFQRDKQHALQITGKGILLYTPVRWIIYFTIILFVLLFAGGQTDFIYFQF